MQGLSDNVVVPVFGVRHDGGQRQTGRSTATDQRQRQAPFLLKHECRRNARRGAPHPIGCPCVRHIQQRAERPGSPPGPERGRHGDLAIGHFPQGPAVLPRHADRMGTRLGETRFVEDQNAGALRQPRPQPTPYALGLPWRVRDEMLKGLIGRRLADASQHRRHRLARAVAQQSVDVPAQRHVLRAMTEAVFELIQPPRQSSQQRPRVPIEHCGAAYRQSANRTMSSIQITREFLRESDDVTKSY